MKKQCFAKKNCKYHTLKIAFLYAALSLFFSVWELYYILTGGERVSRMLLPFAGLVLCMGLGITLMIKNRPRAFQGGRKGKVIKEYCI